MLEMAITLQPSDAIFGYRGRERREGKRGREEGDWKGEGKGKGAERHGGGQTEKRRDLGVGTRPPIG